MAAVRLGWVTKKKFAFRLYPCNGNPGLQGTGEELLALRRSWYLLFLQL